MNKYKILVRKWLPVEESLILEAESEADVRKQWSRGELDKQMVVTVTGEQHVVGVQVHEVKEVTKQVKRKKGA